MTLSGVQKVAASGGELMGVDFDEELPELLPTEEQMIDKRTEEILKNVWIEYDTRMFTKSTPKSDFFDANREAARVLAIKEIEAEREQKLKDEVC